MRDRKNKLYIEVFYKEMGFQATFKHAKVSALRIDSGRAF